MNSRDFAPRLRVRYEETDQMGVVYHGNYLKYFEVGRTEMMRHYGFPYSELEKKGVLLTVVEAQCRYLAGARYDDQLRVETHAKIVSPLRLRFHYRIVREEDEVVVCTGSTDLACLGPDRKLSRLPAEIRRKLEALEIEGSSDSSVDT